MVAALLAAFAAAFSASAQADSCTDATFSAQLSYTQVAVGRANIVSVVSPEGLTDRSTGEWERPARATVTLDDPAAGQVRPGTDDVDATITPTRAGTLGATVAWSQVSNQTGGQCSKSQHIEFDAITGHAPPATILAIKAGDYEQNQISAGLALKGGCSLDNSKFAALPVTWALHWSTNGSPPTRKSRTVKWGSPDPCLLPSDGQKLTGPRRVVNKTFTANRAGYVGYDTVHVIPTFKSHGMRGWWEVTVGGRLVKSTRFRFVAGSGFRTFEGHRFPITGARLEHDTGPCPGLPCTPWGKFPTLAGPAQAGRDLGSVPPPVRDGPVMTSSGGHFLVHYGSAGEAAATHLGDVLEAAYATEVGQWSWPAPVDDGDGKVDLYVFDDPTVEGSAHYDAGPRPVTGWLQMPPDASDMVIAHELLHVLQYAVPGVQPAFFLTEGTAHWAGNRFEAERGGSTTFPPLWANSNYLGVPLDCPATSSCHNNTPAIGQWAWFEYLAEHFDPALVVDVFRRGAAEDGTPAGDLRALTAALDARGAGLGSVFSDYATATASARWTIAPLARIFYPRPSATLTAARVGQKLTGAVTLDHLSQAAVYARPSCSRCTLALKLQVTWPSGLTGVKPAWVRHDLKQAKPLAVAGNSATGTVPLDGTPVPAMLILANPSSALDGQRFAVTATVVPGPPPVLADVAAMRSSRTTIRLTFTASAGGRFVVAIGKLRTTVLAGAGTSSSDLFIGAVRARQKLTITPFDAKGRKGHPVTTRVSP